MTSSIVFRTLVATTVLAFAVSAIPATELQAQEDAYVERGSSPPPSGFFGRFFSPSNSKRGTSRPPRESSTAGGLFVPMKSFSNAFRGRSEPAEVTSERVPLEPFQEVEVEADEEATPAPQSTLPPKSTATRLSLSGAALSASKAQAAATTNSPATASETKPTPGAKPFEATPKSEPIDAKGTSRRGPSSSGGQGSSVGTTLAKTPKSAPAEPKPEAKPKTKPDVTPERPTASLPTASLPPASLPPASPPAASPPAASALSSVPKSAVLPPSPPTQSASSATKPSMTFKTEVKPPALEERKVGGAFLASRSTVIATPEPAANRTAVPKTVTDSNKGLDLQSPGIRLRLVGPDSMLIGQSVPFEVIATNEGQGIVQGLMVRLSAPSHVKVGDVDATEGEFEMITDGEGPGVAWALDRLPSGSSKTLRMMIRTEQAEHFALRLDWTLSHPTAQLPIRVQQPQLQLALEGPTEIDFGSPQIYRLRVSNPGNAEVLGVMVELAAEPYGSNQSEIGDIPAGGERVVEVELTFQQAGRLPIRAKAVSQSANLESLSSIEVDVRQSLLVASWNGPTDFYQGNTADYVLTIENQGLIPSLNNACRVQIPTGVDVAQLPRGMTRSGNQLLWEIDRLAPGEKQDYALQMLLNKLGENSFDFDVESDTGEPAQASLKTVVDAIADLQLSVNDPIAPAPVGQPVTYEITITNRGKKSAEDVFVIAQFSEGIEPTRVDGQAGKLIPGQVLFDAISSIGPNESVVLTITAEATKPGTHRFRASVRCQGTEDDLLKEESTRFTASGITRSERK